MLVIGYAKPTTPTGNDAGPVIAGAGLMVSEYALLENQALSITVMFTLKGLPVTSVGVPNITPVLTLMLRPAGKPVADQVYCPVPPVALIVVGGYNTPTVQEGSDAGAMIISVG